MGSPQWKGRDAIINPEAVHFIKTTLQMDKTGVHSLRAAENFLLRDINENSSKLEKDCFQIAFVIFVMGHVLAPTTKHNYATIDYWGAIANTEAIVQFNWCEYVLVQLLDTVKKLKSDMLANNQSTNLTGCHFFFQIFLLDNLDLGIFNKPHNVIPRISDFDPESFRKMLIMAADPVKGVTSYSHANLRDAATVCYTRQKFPSSVPSSSTSRRPLRGCATPAIGTLPYTTPLPDRDAGHQINTDAAMPSSAAPGPMEFAKYLREKYPHLVADEITMIMKQQYARGLMQLTQASNSIQQALLQARNGLQMDMYKFSDQVINSVSTRCVCCRVRGFTDCPASGTANSKSVRFTTPAAHKIQGKRLELSESEATSPIAQNVSSRKHSANMDDSVSNSKKTTSAASFNVINHFKSCLMSIAEMYADLPANPPITVFGQCSNILQKRKYIFQHGFATDLWCRGVAPHPPHPPTADLIAAHFLELSQQDLLRHYIVHASPRLIRITGMAMLDQLIGSRPLHHELASIIMRRYSQSDQEANSECPYMNWRHNMEPEFATIVLADHEYLTNISIQKQLVGNDIPYDITSCQMFFLPVPLEDGWIVIMWDMMSRKLHVLDPLIRGEGPHDATRDKLEMVVWKLHHALFQCLNEYYAGWPTQDGQWATKYPVIAQETFSRDETGTPYS
ncbi:hypothetical protein CFC21_019175 [Triticum aestivum]|uniref:Ubiquitin-like protease family profile domain-containing protein n=2 Tax=Triticum aestivum TaxID=4565 RepID=A0A3B6B683_WHEAT|nr:uncharacterized protein LOC123190557 [Triticum aestivum]XP_044459159.1 uncharacterized protein LOC123190557 [Triticum aestivum]XP_044459160.1 uncharacterized protein LOC123190557 [Triticum aestivum]XP_044459161.1 uncharacterized protein LOC123190557 [Triticum aestivum]XP_044459162.1 uncharacterized protein LOC123190557 [Triticum aestivum]KAF7003904.1 hypothetical protein CFC21_019175 [Triticum aestivum]